MDNAFTVPVDQIVTQIRRKYSTWSSFEQPFRVTQIVEDVRQSAQALLGRETLLSLLREEQYGEIGERLCRVARPVLDVPSRKSGFGDLRIILAVEEHGCERKFYASLHDLMFGSDEAPVRLHTFIDQWEGLKLGVNPYWAFPTAFLFLAAPGSNILIKPRLMNNFLDFIHVPISKLPTSPDGTSYGRVLTLLQQVQAAMSPYGPRGLYDIFCMISELHDLHTQNRFGETVVG
jgi:hypothetical protein